jgi:uncharacterized repeat protein (TIGR01451 family)
MDSIINMRPRYTLRRWFRFGLFLFCSFFLLSQSQLLALERQHLAGHVPKATATLQSLGSLPPTKELRLAIALPLRNQESLSQLLADLYDPASPRYHQYLTPEQFTVQFGPTEADYDALAAFAEANGLRVTARYSNRLLLDVSGSVAAIEKVFHLNLRLYSHPTENRTFFAPDVEPSVELKVPVLHVTGLTDFELPRPAGLRVLPGDRSSGGTPLDGSGPGGAYRGNDFRRAYAPGVNLNGSGQMVGLLEFDTYYLADITSYRRNSVITTIPLINVFIDGISSTPGANNIEVALDIEVANAMAPGLSAIIVYAGGFGDDILNRMATDNLAKQLSASWTFGASAATDQIFQEFAAQGQAYFNASGDGDAYVGAPSPVDHPFVIAVGGTTLTTGTSASYISETSWNWGLVGSQYVGTGGGISTAFPIPSWQQGIASMATNGGSASFRNVPDVAMIADNVWVAYNNGASTSVGGTSVSAPLWAAFTALINQQAVSNAQPVVGFLNPAVYAIGNGPSYATNFHDIATGNNTNAANPTRFFATSSYDLCTGWGSPTGSNTINALAPRINARVITNAGTSFAAEGCVPGNSAVDPNEVVTLNFSLRNLGGVKVTNLVATLQASGGVLAPSAAQNYGSLDPGVTVSRPFTFTASGACGSTLVATLTLQDGADNLGALNFNFPLGKPIVTLSQNFEPLTLPSLPAGWTTTTTNGGIAWVTSNTAKDTTPNSAFAAESTVAGLTELISPPIAITTSSALLSFKQNYNFETDPALFTNAYDGGVLEIKIGAGAFTDILAAGGSFVTNGYNRSISTTNTDNPLFGRQVWSALSPGFITTTVNLPAAAAGQSVQFKWRFGTDNGNAFGGTGWYIDTISVQDGFACCVPMADLAIGQAPSTNIVLLGQDLSYTLSVSNLSLQSASAVLVTDAIPANVTFSSASPGCIFTNGIVICNLGTMNAGDSNGVTVTVTPLSVGLYTNVVSVGSTLLDPSLANNFSTNVTTVSTNIPPAFTLQPTNVIVAQGGNAFFFASASGVPAPTYQWLFNGSTVSGATSTALSINNAQASNIGNYQAVATNSAGSATSSVAHLTVLIAPPIQFAGIGANGTNVTISVNSVTGLTYRLEYKNLLTDPVWTPVAPALPGTGGSLSLVDTNTPLAPSRFYRVSAF